MSPLPRTRAETVTLVVIVVFFAVAFGPELVRRARARHIQPETPHEIDR